MRSARERVNHPLGAWDNGMGNQGDGVHAKFEFAFHFNLIWSFICHLAFAFQEDRSKAQALPVGPIALALNN